MEKYKSFEIKPFSFSDLKGTHVVSNTNYDVFNFKDLASEALNVERATEDEIRIERNFAEKNSFKVDELVRNYRGLSSQEQSDLEKKIQDEVKKRLDQSYQQAYSEGLEKGREEGKELAHQEYRESLNKLIDDFGKQVLIVQDSSARILEKNKNEIYTFIKRFTKWIVMKEANEKLYLESLLEKLILEINARKNLIIKVGQASFQHMPEVISTVESRLGNLTNVRIEIVPEISYPGIVLESESGLIDGSLEGVFKNIDKIFEQVINHE